MEKLAVPTRLHCEFCSNPVGVDTGLGGMWIPTRKEFELNFHLKMQ